MMPSRLAEACRIAFDARRRDARSYSLAAVGERGDAVVTATNLLSFGVQLRAHAECRCIRKMGYGGVVYVARIRKDGSVGCAKPCGGCQLAAKFKNLKIIYTISESEYGVI